MKVKELIETLQRIDNKDAEILISVNEDAVNRLNLGSELMYCEIKTEDPKDVEDLALLFIGDIVMS